MNGNDESIEMQQRRAVLKRVAWMLGGAVSAPAALAILQGCSAKESLPGAALPSKFFKGKQADIMAAIADVLIPRTETSGALDAGVPAFIDAVMADVYPKDAQDRFGAGIDAFAITAGAGGRAFLDQEVAQKAAIVQQAIDAALTGEHQDKPFILVARELTLLGFYTSRVGITENMEYVAVPTVFHGCVPLSQMKKHVYWE
jgi:glucoside 3-dehydrogenase (cytochrome c) hitch-hiker subunit